MQATAVRHRPVSPTFWRVSDIILALAPVLALVPGTDPDLWGHLRFGLDTLAARALPAVDSYQAFSQGGRRRAAVSHEQVATAALRTFLEDVFPALQPPVHCLDALSDTAAEPPSWSSVDSAGAGRAENLAEAVVRIQAADGPVLSTSEVRDKLAVALRDCRFTASQRATQPFVFRRSGLLDARSGAWTIRDAVKRMGRYPLDGVYHLYNGTLEYWLEEQGAADLAELARVAMNEGRADRRKALEIFLSGTGLVARPSLVARPKVLDMGYAITGETIVGHIRVSRGQGRGYLFGTMKPGAPWLKVWPGALAGGAVNLAVTADTLRLLIRTDPYEEHVMVDCSAAAEPILLAVRVRVMPNPTPLNRFLFRPFVGLLLGLILGVLVAWAWARVAPALPAPLTAALHMGSVLAWTLAVTALWTLAGLVRGLLQTWPWSVLYAARGWLIRLALWAPVLALVGFGLATWWQNGFGPPGEATGLLRAQAALAGLVLATAPAAAFSLRRHPAPVLASPARLLYIAPEDPSPGAGTLWVPEHAREIAWCTLGVVLMVLVLVFAPRLAHTDWAVVGSEAPATAAQSWIETRWGELNTGANDLLDRLYLRYYDRRAPLPPTAGPTAVPQGTPTPTGGGKE